MIQPQQHPSAASFITLPLLLLLQLAALLLLLLLLQMVQRFLKCSRYVIQAAAALQNDVAETNGAASVSLTPPDVWQPYTLPTNQQRPG